VWHGTLDTMPEAWVHPDAVVLFFVLHHLEDPMSVLRTIRSRWPAARVVAAQYGPTNFHPERSAPPRTLTRWSAKSLSRALGLAGYSAEVHEFRSTLADAPALRPTRRLLRRTVFAPAIFRTFRRLERRFLRLQPGTFGLPGFVLLGLAEPYTTESPPPI
jgi:hypothetical protein